MDERKVILLGIVAAFGLAVLTGLLTDEPATLLGYTPFGVAIFLTVGVGVPQYLLYRRGGANVHLGFAVLAVAGGATAVLGSELLFRAGNRQIDSGIVELLLIVVLGVSLSAIVRAFVDGFRSTSK